MTTHVVGPGCFGNWLAVFVLVAAVVFCALCVRGALFRNCIVLLQKKAVKEAPPAMAALCHEVALESELGR